MQRKNVFFTCNYKQLYFTLLKLQEKPVQKSPSGDGGVDLDLSLSLQQAKERAHQKRSNKKAPPMDWSKRSELFSNL